MAAAWADIPAGDGVTASTAKLVYLAVAALKYPRVEQVAVLGSLSTRTAGPALAWLVKQGLIQEIETPGPNGIRGHKTYTTNLHKIITGSEKVAEPNEESAEPEIGPSGPHNGLGSYRGTGKNPVRVSSLSLSSPGLLPSPIQQKKVKRLTMNWKSESGFTGITAQDRARWEKAYPACDIDRQLAAMDSWLRSNPRKAHKSNWERFITNWLARQQDRGGDAASNRPRDRREDSEAPWVTGNPDSDPPQRTLEDFPTDDPIRLECEAIERERAKEYDAMTPEQLAAAGIVYVPPPNLNGKHP